MPDEKILQKIQYMLNMTVENGCTEAEAIAASAKVEELLLAYNLEMFQVEQLSGVKQEPVTYKKIDDIGIGRYEPVEWAMILCTAIGIMTFTKPTINRYFRTFTFIGRDTNVQIAVDMYYYLYQQVVTNYRLSKKLRPKDMDGIRFKNSFMMGCARRLHDRIQSSVWEKAAQTTTAIVASHEVENDDFAKTLFSKIHTAKQSNTIHDAQAYYHGAKAADKVDINDKERLNDKTAALTSR